MRYFKSSLLDGDGRDDLREARARLRPGDSVHVPRFDKTGKVIRVDHKRHTAIVSVGLGQWEVSAEEVVPQH